MRVVLGVAGIRMRMDDLDAVDLVRMVKERRIRTPIIAFTKSSPVFDDFIVYICLPIP